MRRVHGVLVLSALLSFLPAVHGQNKRPTPGPGTTTTPGIPRPSMNNGVSRIEIKITNEQSRPINSAVLVELGNMGGGVSQQAYTNTEGRVSFTAPTGASYQVRVTGVDVEATTATVDIYPGETFHTESIAVKFKPDPNHPAPGGLVSAADLKIPEKAHKEFTKGMELLDKKKFEEAKKHFEKAIEEYPKYDWAYNNIGVADIQLKDIPGAKTAFEKAVEINDKNPDATKNLAKIKLQENDIPAAKDLLIKSNAAMPGNPDTLVLLAYTQFKTKDLDAALANAEKCHVSEPDRYPLGHLIAGAVREAKGDRKGAERQYQTFLKEAPDAPQAQVAKEGLARLQTQAQAQPQAKE